MDKAAQYEQIQKHLRAVFAAEGQGEPVSDMVKMVTINSILYHELDYFDWVGFYLKVGENRLEIGPYQGTVGCFFIPFGKGVCGTVAATGKTVIVPDVNAFTGHIACDARTRSEIVIPVYQNSELWGVFDVDSHQPAAFDHIDQYYLENILTEWFQHP